MPHPLLFLQGVGTRRARLLHRVLRFANSKTNRVLCCTEEIPRSRNHGPARRCRISLSLAQCADNFRSWHSRRHFVHRNASDDAPRIQNEHRRLCNAAFFAGIVNAPLAHHDPLRITQNGKLQAELLPHRLRFFRPVYGNRRQPCARRANCRVKLLVLRQLAEAKWSPMPAIKEQDQRTGRAKFRQSPQRSSRIHQLKIRSCLTRLQWRLANCRRHRCHPEHSEGSRSGLCPSGGPSSAVFCSGWEFRYIFSGASIPISSSAATNCLSTIAVSNSKKPLFSASSSDKM